MNPTDYYANFILFLTRNILQDLIATSRYRLLCFYENFNVTLDIKEFSNSYILD